MSAAELSATIRNRIIDNYRNNVVKLGTLGPGTMKDLASQVVDKTAFREAFTSKDSGHTALITEDGLNSIIKDIESNAPTPVLKKWAAKVMESVNYIDFVQFMTSDTNIHSFGEGVIGARANIPQKTQKTKFIEYIDKAIQSTGAQKATKEALKAYISDNIQAGHLAGIFSLKVKQAFSADIEVTGNTYRDISVTISDSEESKDLEKDLEVIIKALLDADFLTSNIVDKVELMTTSTKKALGSNPSMETEMQFKSKNEDAGKLLIAAGGHINNLIKTLASGALSSDGNFYYKKFIGSLANLNKVIISEAKALQKNSTTEAEITLAKSILSNSKTLDALIKSPGSVPILKGIGVNIQSIIETGKELPEVVTRVSSKTTIIKVAKGPKAINTAIKNTIEVLNSAKSKVKKSSPLRLRNLQTGKFTSLASLQLLLNQALSEQIKRNMGSGNRKDILNLRSGRFADSVKVERMSQSREGMISAFYSYMKYPYQTFEPGFKQGKPASRDPKLLISKSIREIASAMVKNKMRAVRL